MQNQGGFQSAKQLVSILFTASILFGASVVLSPFLLAIIWAAILAVATWQLRERIVARLKSDALAVACSATLVLFFLVGQMALLLVFLSQDVYYFTTYLIDADTYGKAAPQVLYKMPFVSDWLIQYWNKYLAAPKQLSSILEAQLDVIRSAAQSVFFDLSSRLATLLFALWVLYFFYQECSK